MKKNTTQSSYQKVSKESFSNKLQQTPIRKTFKSKEKKKLKDRQKTILFTKKEKNQLHNQYFLCSLHLPFLFSFLLFQKLPIRAPFPPPIIFLILSSFTFSSFCLLHHPLLHTFITNKYLI